MSEKLQALLEALDDECGYWTSDDPYQEQLDYRTVRDAWRRIDALRKEAKGE